MQLFGSKFEKIKHVAALLLKIKEQKDIFCCISLERLKNAVFGKEIAVGLKYLANKFPCGSSNV